MMHLTALLIAASLALTQTPDTLAVARVTEDRNASFSSSAPAQTVSSNFITTTGATSLTEALRSFGGLSIKDYGGVGGLKTVDIRSFGSHHTGISYDGFPLGNVQNGQVDIGRFDIEEVQSLRVDISGSDDIFRSARLAGNVGVLSIRTKNPLLDTSRTAISSHMRVASFGTYNPYLSVMHKFSPTWSARVSANYLASDGTYPFTVENGAATQRQMRLNSDVRALSSEINLDGDLGFAGRLALKLRYYDSERGLPGSVVLYSQNPTERLWDRDFLAGCNYETSSRDAWRVRASLCYSSAWNRYENTDIAYAIPADDRYLQQECGFSAIVMHSLSREFSLSLAQDVYINSLDANISNCLYPTRESSYTALSAKYESDQLTAVATLLGTIVREQTGVGEPAPGRERLSPSVSASYKPLSEVGLRIRASYKESFRLPTFNDMYYPRVGNKMLSPEIAQQCNLGLLWDVFVPDGTMSISVDAYRNEVKDKIVAVPTMFIWSMRNVGRVSMSGCDMAASFNGKISSSVALRTALRYSYQYAVDVTSPTAKNYKHQIAYTPRHSGNASLVLEMPWINIGYTLQAVGERYTLAQNTPAYRIDPYFDHMLSLNRDFRIGKRHPIVMHVSAEALNITDTNYEVIKYYPMPGRNYRMTIKITY